MKNNFFNKNVLNNNIKHKIKRKVISEGLKFIDIEEIIKEKQISIDSIYPEGNFYEQHFNEKGYKLISNIIFNNIKL